MTGATRMAFALSAVMSVILNMNLAFARSAVCIWESISTSFAHGTNMTKAGTGSNAAFARKSGM